VPLAAEDIRQAIDADGGSIRFDEFVRLALYGEHGFYVAENPGRAGRRGDFLTSPEVGPLFGTVIACALDEWWEQLGRPNEFDVVEAGAGPGTLARTVFSARPRCLPALRYTAVEISASQRAMHPRDVVSVSEFPHRKITGVVIANELLDNLPFRLFVFDGGWREAHVGFSDGRFVEHLVPCETLPTCLPEAAAHGARAAVHDAARGWVESALSCLEAGLVMAIDYCTTTSDMTTRPWRDWLRTYALHARGSHYLSNVGAQDITVEVAIDQLPPPSSVTTQAEFLRRYGIERLVEEGKRVWRDNAPHPDLATMKMRSRVSEAEALLDHSGLGGFNTLEWKVQAKALPRSS